MVLQYVYNGDTFSVKYYIKDTQSTLYISHYVCTECLDAYVGNGIVFIPNSVAQKNLKRKKLSSSSDLKLIGIQNVNEELFGNQNNFINKWHDKFLIKEKL